MKWIKNGVASLATSFTIAVESIFNKAVSKRVVYPVGDYASNNSGKDLAENTTKELGNWEKTNEAMSDASRDYQKYITGADDGMVYKVNGVKFDGFKDGVLIEAKGNYSNFVNKGTGEFYDWFNGKASLIDQANRQLNAANGTRIQWYFNDEVSMNAVKDLFNGKIQGIDYILKPMQ